MPLQTNYSMSQTALLADVEAQQEDGLLDYAGFGTASVVISGATGLVNTAIGVGEMLGIADESDYIDEGRAVTSFLGQEGGEFYLRHKEGVDFLGMIASSIVPGAAGVKALRYAQKIGKISNPLQYSTGLKNADILLDSPVVRAAKAEALKSNSVSLLNPEYIKAVSAGFKQQVLENIAFTAGTVLLNNQNASLNPDDLNYLDAAGSQLIEGLPFIGVGAVVGGAIDALRIGGAVKRYVKAEHNRVVYTSPEGAQITAGAMRNLSLPEMQGLTNGDALIALAAESNVRGKIQQGLYMKDGSGAEILPEMNQFAYNNIEDSKNILNGAFNKVVADTNKAGTAGYKVLKGMFDDLSNANADRKYALAALDSVAPITQKSVRAADPEVLRGRRTLDARALQIDGAEAKLAKRSLEDMDEGEFLGVSTRMAQAGTVHSEELLKIAQSKIGHVLKEVDPKLTKQYGSPLAALVRDSDRLLDEGKITQEVYDSIQPRTLTAFVNTNSKEVYTKITPRIADFGEVKMTKVDSPKLASLHSPALKQTFRYSEGAFAAATTGKIAGATEAALPKLQQLDANYHIAHKINVNYNTKKPLTVDPTDIAQMERLFVDVNNPELIAAYGRGAVLLGPRQATAANVTKTLIQSKSRLIANLQENGWNVDDISVAANVSPKVVMGEEPLNAGNVVGRSNFDEPEWLRVTYKDRNIKDYNKQINDYAGQSARDKLYATQKEIAMAELGHKELLDSLPTLQVRDIDNIANLDDRTGLLKRFNADFGTLRESAGYIGKQVNEASKKLQMKVNTQYASFENKFNKPENGVLRAELELATNFLRTGDMMLMGNNLVRKSALQQVAKEAAKDLPEGEVLDVQDLINGLGQGDAVSLSDDVRGVMEMWQYDQANAMVKRASVANVLGTHMKLDQDILRAPAVDLRQYRMVAFVRPNTAKMASDPTKYMIYAQSAEELNTKIGAIRQSIGEDYHIIRNGEDAEYFKAMQEYEFGHEFRDLYADISKENRGRTADVLPPLGQDTSRALADMKRTAFRNEQYVLRSSVELKNAEVLEQLRRYGDYVDSAESKSLLKNFTSRASHIYTDTVGLMLDLPSYKGQGMELWNEVNTAIAQRGSKVVDFVSAQGSVIGKGVRALNESIGKLRGKNPTAPVKLQEQDYAKINQMMADQGFTSPLQDVSELIMQSSDPKVSNSLSELSRTMSNLVSMTLLRADPAHSIMQLTSSTILSLPVLQELRTALPEVAAKLTGVVHPTTGIVEPNIHKLYFKGVARGFSSQPDAVEFRNALKDRGIISDYIGQFLETTDMSQLNGSHTYEKVQAKLNDVAGFVSKYSGHTKSEEVARFAIADAVREMCVARGIPDKEMWPIISNAVDKVHGNYTAGQRPQLFNGVIGQNVGLFQTYFFNIVQHMTKHIADGSKRQLATMAALQSSMFGAQSIPGFNTLNSLVAGATGSDSDLYSISDANNPDSWSAYGMFGLASQAFGIDFSGRGNLNPRYASIVPTEFANLATVSTLTGAIGNLYNTVGMLSDGNVTVGAALAHGLAHNGMNRPLQGLGTILQNAATSNTGQVDVANVNMDPAGNIAWGAMFSRVIGARPMDEAILRSHFYRQAGYDAAHREKMAELGATLQQGGVEDWGQIATEYESAGGDLQNFNAFVLRNMQTASEGKLGKFRQETEEDSALNRSITRMQYRDSLKPYWE